TPQYCDYALPRHLPLERLEWKLADANTLAPVELLAQYEAGEAGTTTSTPTHHHHHLIRGSLHELRRKTEPAPTGVLPAWQPLQHTTVYWLRLPEGEVRSPELRMGAGFATQLRVQPAGGMVQLGAKPPTIRVGAHAASLVFLAREPAPYRLAWGGADATSTLPLAQLMPTRQAGDALPTDTATVQIAPTVLVAASQASTLASAAPAAPAASRKLWLWVALLAALGLMGFMAWSLLRPAAKV
ncbi:MAG: DUF3999 family protein, partial [Rhizobacter sp.]